MFRLAVAASLLAAALPALAHAAAPRGDRTLRGAGLRAVHHGEAMHLRAMHLRAVHRGKVQQRARRAQEPLEERKGGATDSLTLGHWMPLLFSVGGLLVTPELLRPLVERYLPGGRPILEVSLLALVALGNSAVVLMTRDPAAAGAAILPTTAAALCLFAALAVGVALGLRYRRGATQGVLLAELPDALELLLGDSAPLLRPALRGAATLLALHVVAQANAWGQLFVPLGLLVLGLALAVSGVAGGVLAHVRIRLDGRIVEGSCTLFRGDEVLVKQLKWRHTVGLIMSKRATIYIPNGELVGSTPIVWEPSHASQINVHVGFEGETLRDGGLREAVKGAWDLLAVTGGEGFSFQGCDGRTYGNRFDTPQCEVWVNDTGDTLHLKLVGRPALQDCEAVSTSRQEVVRGRREVERNWHIQVEWLNLRLRSFCKELAV